MLTGYSNNFPTDTLFDNGIIKVGSVVWGVTKGQSSFTPNSVLVNSDFDGKAAPIKQLDRLIHGEPVIQFTAMELGPSASGNQLAKLLMGSAEVTSGTTPNTKTVVTPQSGNQYLASNHYLTDFRLIFERAVATGAGIKKYASLHFAIAVVLDWGPVQGANKDHPTFQVKVAGRVDPAASLSLAAYDIELLESLP